jgi:hypothetical protein
VSWYLFGLCVGGSGVTACKNSYFWIGITSGAGERSCISTDCYWLAPSSVWRRLFYTRSFTFTLN